MVASEDIGQQTAKAIRSIVDKAEKQIDPSAALTAMAQSCLEEGARLAVIARFNNDPKLAGTIDLEQAVAAAVAKIENALADVFARR